MEETKTDPGAPTTHEDGDEDGGVTEALGDLTLEDKTRGGDESCGFGDTPALDLVELVCREEFDTDSAVVMFGGTVLFMDEPGPEWGFNEAVLSEGDVKRLGTAGVTAVGVDAAVKDMGYDIAALRADTFAQFGVPGALGHGLLKADFLGDGGAITDKTAFRSTMGTTLSALKALEALGGGPGKPVLSADTVKHFSVLVEAGWFKTFIHPDGEDVALTIFRADDLKPVDADADADDDGAADDEELHEALDSLKSVGVMWHPSLIQAHPSESLFNTRLPINAALCLDVVMRCPVANVTVEMST